MKEKIEQFVENIEWTFAKTYADTAPHEYIVREKISDEDQKMFDLFATFIEKEGYDKNFYDETYRYYNFGEKRYWVMENILNRCDKKDEYPVTK